MTIVDHETEIVPGIQAIAAPGYTPGHMALTIFSGGEQLLCISNVALHPIHLEQPDWYAAVRSLPVSRPELHRSEARGVAVVAY